MGCVCWKQREEAATRPGVCRVYAACEHSCTLPCTFDPSGFLAPTLRPLLGRARTEPRSLLLLPPGGGTKSGGSPREGVHLECGLQELFPDQGREKREGEHKWASIGPHEVEFQGRQPLGLGMPLRLVFTLGLQDRRWGQGCGVFLLRPGPFR